MNDTRINGYERGFKKKSRFANPYDLWGRYNDLKTKDPYTKNNLRNALISQYVRDNYERDDGKETWTEPNYGQFAFKVDSYMGVFIDAIFERPQWMKIKTYEYDEDNPQTEDTWSNEITECFHSAFVASDPERFRTDLRSIFDMALFGKGYELFIDYSYKTKHIPIERVLPDEKAKMEPKTFDLLFIRDEVSLIELYDKSQSKECLEAGWNKEAIYNILRNPTMFSSSGHDGGRLEGFRNGDASQSEQDHVIKVVYAYVKEYKPNDKGFRISKYIFPEDAWLLGDFDSEESYKQSSAEDKKSSAGDYLFYKPYVYKCFSEIGIVRAESVTESFWETRSFAEKIYQAAVFYDMAMNKVIRSVLRNMSLILSSSTSDQAERFRNMVYKEVIVLDPSDTVQQNRIQTDVAHAVQVVRQVMIDTEQGIASGSSPGSQNVKGYAITAKEAELEAQQEGGAKSISIRTFFANDARFYAVMYAKAVHLDKDMLKEETLKEEKRALEYFERKMKRKGIPKKAYEKDSVCVTPQFNPFGANTGQRIANAQALLRALAFTPATQGQEAAQRDFVSTLVGRANVDDYIEGRQYKEENARKAGAENEDLDNPLVNPVNVPVLPSDKHMIEIPVHLADYAFKLNAAMGIIQRSQAENNPIVKGILFYTAKDMIIAQDNKGGHIEAHIEVALQDESKKEELQPILVEFNKLRRAQDQMTAQLEQIEKQFQQDAEKQQAMSMDLQFKAMNHQMDLKFKEQLNDLAVWKKVETNRLANMSKESKLEYDQQKQVEDMSFSQAEHEIELQNQVNDNNSKSTRNSNNS